MDDDKPLERELAGCLQLIRHIFLAACIAFVLYKCGYLPLDL